MVRDEHGALSSLWWLMVVGAALPPLLGIVVDGGGVVDARAEAVRVAEQAARAGADSLDSGDYFGGGAPAVDPEMAAQAYLADAGMAGSVAYDGLDVTVTVRTRYDTRWLSAVGLDTYSIVETGSATVVDRR